MCGHPPKNSNALTCSHPVFELLTAQGPRKEVTTRAQDRHEQLRIETDGEITFVVNGDRETRKIHEEFFTGLVVLAHGHVTVFAPGPVELTELAVAVTTRVQLAIFEPQQLQRHFFFR